MRNTIALSLLLLAIAAAPTRVEAQTCSTANDYECPAGSSSRHNLYLALFGAIDMSGSDTVWLGSYGNGTLGACYTVCNAGTPCFDLLVQLVDEQGGTGSGMHYYSQFCGMAGSDNITVATANHTCGSNTLYPFIGNGYDLTIYGNDGNDSLTSISQPVGICGGPGNDSLEARGINSTLDGYDGDDTLYQEGQYSYEWGGNGYDTIRAYGGSTGVTANVSGGADDDCILVAGYSTVNLTCGGNGSHTIHDSTNVTPLPSDCEYSFPLCPAY